MAPLINQADQMLDLPALPKPGLPQNSVFSFSLFNHFNNCDSFLCARKAKFDQSKPDLSVDTKGRQWPCNYLWAEVGGHSPLINLLLVFFSRGRRF